MSDDVAVRLTRANKLLDRALAEEDHETANAAAMFVQLLRREGFQRGDLLLASTTGSIEDQLYDLTKTYVALLQEHTDLNKRFLDLLSSRSEVVPPVINKRLVLNKPAQVKPAPDATTASGPTVQPELPLGKNPRRFREVRPSSDLWTEPVLRKMINEWLRGTNFEEIARQLSDMTQQQVTTNMINGQLYNNPPPDFLNVTIRPLGDPTDWFELWYIGAVVFRGTNGTQRVRGWKKETLAACKVASSIAPPTDPNNSSIADHIDDLRTQALGKNIETRRMRQSDQPCREFIDYLRTAGPTGVAWDEAKKMLNRRRIAELERFGKIFDCGQRKHGQRMLVSSEYSDCHVTAYSRAKEKFAF